MSERRIAPAVLDCDQQVTERHFLAFQERQLSTTVFFALSPSFPRAILCTEREVPAEWVSQQVGDPGSGAQGPLAIGEDIGDSLKTGQQSVLLLVLEPSLYLLVGPDDCRVVAVAEMAADLAVRGAGMLARQVHGQHPEIRCATIAPSPAPSSVWAYACVLGANSGGWEETPEESDFERF